MKQKKTAVMIYPHFSLQEITCLTSYLAIADEREQDVFASSMAPINSEEGFQVTANKTFSEFHAQDYSCLILPGIINPLPALFDEENIAFLRGLRETELLIASISSSPLLLAKAGLLVGRRFTSGVFEEILRGLDFVPQDGIVYQPVCKDGNLITASGIAFREFCFAVLQALEIPYGDRQCGCVDTDYNEADFKHEMGEVNCKAFMAAYQGYLS